MNTPYPFSYFHGVNKWTTKEEWKNADIIMNHKSLDDSLELSPVTGSSPLFVESNICTNNNGLLITNVLMWKTDRCVSYEQAESHSVCKHNCNLTWFMSLCLFLCCAMLRLTTVPKAINWFSGKNLKISFELVAIN